MNKFQLLGHILRDKGWRYVSFRVPYELKRKTGRLKKDYPTMLSLRDDISLDVWRRDASPFFFHDRGTVKVRKMRNNRLNEDVSRLMKGEILFFSAQWLQLGKDYDWVTNPLTGYRYDSQAHWTAINDMDPNAGDIKFVWEKSRFSYLYTVIRNDFHNDEDHSEFVFNEMIDWIEKNPLNCGPNYKCSQETSIRLLNWIFTLYFYRYSESLTGDIFQTILSSVYWQARHVRSNINFSRIAVRNNHAITETLTLYIVGLLFPWFPEADEWKKNGKKWFEQEIEFQIQEDGTFIQDSMNYHRVVIQLLTWAIALAHLNGEHFRECIYKRAYHSTDFLFQCQEPSNGWLPNYGANDGALFFPLSDFDYRDYRPQLDALYKLLTDKSLYNVEYEDSQWICGNVKNLNSKFNPIVKQHGLVAFKDSGYYLIREENTLTFIRCGLFKKNGSTDQLHVDVWYRGENVIMDGGSFLYNTEEKWKRFFMGTESHNTVMLGDYDQMMKGPRFTWFYKPQLMDARVSENEEYYEFEGCMKCFSFLDSNIVHHRRVRKYKSKPQWEVWDEIEHKPTSLKLRQLWHIPADNTSVVFDSDASRITKDAWVSNYYGVKEKCSQVEFCTSKSSVYCKIVIAKK